MKVADDADGEERNRMAKPERDDRDGERWKERGVMLRVFVYVFATHLFAGFVWILFYVGQHASK